MTSWLTTKAWVLNGQQLFKGHTWCLTEYLKLAVYSSLRIDATADATTASEATASCYAHKAIGCSDDGAECERATQQLASCAVPFTDAGASSKEVASAHRAMNKAALQMQSMFQQRLQTQAVKILRKSVQVEKKKSNGFKPKTMAAFLTSLEPVLPACGECQGATKLEPGVIGLPMVARGSTMTTMVCGENKNAPLEGVADLETFLKCNGFLAPSGISGTQREYFTRAMRSFQFIAGTAMTGKSDADTIAAMRQYVSGDPPTPVTVAPGQDFTCELNWALGPKALDTVAHQQVWLQCNGFLVNGGVTGQASSEFAVAVQQFQLAACIPVDGRVGAKTQDAMRTYSPSTLPAACTEVTRPDRQSSTNPDPSKPANCVANSKAKLNDVIDYKTFFRCNGFSFGTTYDNTEDYTFLAAMEGFQSVVNLPQTGRTSDDLKRAIRQYAAKPPQIRLGAQIPAIQPLDFSIMGKWNPTTSADPAPKDDAEMMSMSLDDAELKLKRAMVLAKTPNDRAANAATAAVLAAMKRTIAASRKEAMANPKPRFAMAGLMSTQIRVLLGALGLSVTGSKAQVHARLRDFAKQDATERCPLVVKSVWAVTDNANRVVEALPGCVGVRWSIPLPLGIVSIGAAVWVNMPRVQAQADILGGDVEFGIEVTQQTFSQSIKLSELKKGIQRVFQWTVKVTPVDKVIIKV